VVSPFCAALHVPDDPRCCADAGQGASGTRGQPDGRGHRQSVRESSGGKTRGYDAGKKIVGRKRHIAVDTDGRLLMVNLTPADMSDSAGAQMILDGRDGAALVLDTIRKRFPWLELVWADAGYNARQVKDAVARSPGLRLESSSEPTTSKASSCCPVDGSSREPSHGSAATAASPRTMRTSPTPSPPS
jgi:hypothetical protein